MLSLSTWVGGWAEDEMEDFTFIFFLEKTCFLLSPDPRKVVAVITKRRRIELPAIFPQPLFSSLLLSPSHKKLFPVRKSEKNEFHLILLSCHGNLNIHKIYLKYVQFVATCEFTGSV